MPKHAAHATLERERTLSRIVADDEPVSPAALEECFGVLPLGDAGAKRRRYTCGKCRDAGLPAEGHMASQAVCPR